MSGMKFRKSCDICNVTFFTPNRTAVYCAKCSKRMGVAETVSSTEVPAKPGRGASIDGGRSRAGVAAAEAVVAKPRGPVLVKKKVKKGPRPPKPTELTPELRQQIIAAVAEANGSSELPVRDLHATIAEKLWVRRWMVAEVIQSLTSVQIRMTPEQRAEAAHRYRDMVESHERPVGGRRKAIAAAMNMPIKEVIVAVRDWARKQEADSPTPRLSRQQLFDVEKAYWEQIGARKHPLDSFPDALSESLGFANRWQVLRWIDVLHDDPRSFENVPDPDEKDRDAIIATYQEYLASDAPPEKGLHQTIADRLGPATKPRQVHKVLQNYRHACRAKYKPKK